MDIILYAFETDASEPPSAVEAPANAPEAEAA